MVRFILVMGVLAGLMGLAAYWAGLQLSGQTDQSIESVISDSVEGLGELAEESVETVSSSLQDLRHPDSIPDDTSDSEPDSSAETSSEPADEPTEESGGEVIQNDTAEVSEPVDTEVISSSDDVKVTDSFEGSISWYGPGLAGNQTASGEIFDPSQLTAAHRTLPFDTRVRVTNKANGQSVTVRINDRGPFIDERVLDVSQAAAEILGFIEDGHTDALIEVLE